MKVLADTSVLVAAMVESHPAHGRVVPWLQSPPGLSSRDAVKKRIEILGAAAASGPDSRGATIFAPYEQ